MIYYIVNPAAGAGKSGAVVPLVEKLTRCAGRKYAVIETEKPNDIERIARLIDLGKADAIVCVGGDGTVHEYAGLAVGRDVKFGAIPAGSANDLLNSLPGNDKKIKSYDDKIAYYVDKVLAGATKTIDAILFNGEKYFLNIGGIGIETQVINDALPLKKYIGGGAYFLSLMKNAAVYKASELTLSVDGAVETDTFLSISVCNGAYYGGNLKIAPPAILDDGKITLCKIRKMPRLKLAALFPAVKPGWHAGFKEVSYVNCERVELAFGGKKTVNLDGNLEDFESPLVFEIVKGAVNFII